MPLILLLLADTPGAIDWHELAISLGLLLGMALLAGQLVQLVRLPRVTAYLLVGLALGPQALAVIPHDHLGALDPLGKMAMALVLFNMGCRFKLPRLRRYMRRVLRMSGGELGLTFVLVALGLWTLGILGLAAVTWQIAILFGALAIATAPATTMLVFREYESEGPLTEYARALVALNNLVCVILFELLFVFVHATAGDASVSISHELQLFAGDLLGSISLGIAIGIVASFSCGLLPSGRWLVLFVSLAALGLGICMTAEIPYLLTFLAMGATLANASDRADEVTGVLDRFTGMLCVVFFVVHGAELRLDELYKAGIVGVAYIVLRSIGKYFGVYFSVDPRESRDVRRWLGAALLSQAGAAIALSDIASERDPELGGQLKAIILGTVVFFEIIGPILARLAVLKSGEVPLFQAIRHTSTTPLDELRSLVNRVLVAVGFRPWRGKPVEELTVTQLMRRNVQPLSASASFADIVYHIEHSHDNTFPVVTDEGTLMGVVRYAEVRHALFDPMVGELVRAADLVVQAPVVLHTSDPITTAARRFRASRDDCIPVVTGKETPVYAGILRRRDVLSMVVRSSTGGDKK